MPQLQHLYALLKMAKQRSVEQVFLHCFMDGRDTPPQSGIGYIREIQKHLDEFGVGKIASVEGRYYAMDRDKRWERIERAFNAMVLGNAEKSTDPVAVMQRSYERDVTDEFIEPVTIVDETKQPVALIVRVGVRRVSSGSPGRGWRRNPTGRAATRSARRSPPAPPRGSRPRGGEPRPGGRRVLGSERVDARRVEADEGGRPGQRGNRSARPSIEAKSNLKWLGSGNVPEAGARGAAGTSPRTWAGPIRPRRGTAAADRLAGSEVVPPARISSMPGAPGP